MFQETHIFQGSGLIRAKTSYEIKIRTVIFSIFLIVITGIVGNRSDAVFLQLYATIAHSTLMHRWMIGGVTMVAFGAIGLWLKDRIYFKRILQEKKFLADLSKILNGLLTTTLPIQDSDARLHKFVLQAFKYLTRKYLNDIYQCVLFLPDSEKEHLIISEAYGLLDEKSKSEKTFCINLQKGNAARGVAGEAFMQGRTIVAHISVENGHPRSDEASYIPSRDSICPFYGSLVCVPLIAGEESTDCLGVLCFDSYNTFLFDSPVVVEGLRLIAERISMLLLTLAKP